MSAGDISIARINRKNASMAGSSRPVLQSPIRLIVPGLLLLLAAAGILAVLELQSLVTEMEQESVALHRLVSQRADQHDAHLAALSALAAA